MSSPVRATVPAPSSSAKGFSMSAPGHSMSKPSMQRRTFHAGGPGPGSYDPTVGERAIKPRAPGVKLPPAQRVFSTGKRSASGRHLRMAKAAADELAKVGIADEGRSGGFLGRKMADIINSPGPGEYGDVGATRHDRTGYRSEAAMNRRRAARGELTLDAAARRRRAGGTDGGATFKQSTALAHVAPHPKQVATYEDLKAAGRTPGPGSYSAAYDRDSLAARTMGYDAVKASQASALAARRRDVRRRDRARRRAAGEEVSDDEEEEGGHGKGAESKAGSALDDALLSTGGMVSYQRGPALSTSRRVPMAVVPRAHRHPSMRTHPILADPRMQWIIPPGSSGRQVSETGDIGPGTYTRAGEAADALRPLRSSTTHGGGFTKALRFSTRWQAEVQHNAAARGAFYGALSARAAAAEEGTVRELVAAELTSRKQATQRVKARAAKAVALATALAQSGPAGTIRAAGQVTTRPSRGGDRSLSWASVEGGRSVSPGRLAQPPPRPAASPPPTVPPLDLPQPASPVSPSQVTEEDVQRFLRYNMVPGVRTGTSPTLRKPALLMTGPGAEFHVGGARARATADNASAAALVASLSPRFDLHGTAAAAAQQAAAEAAEVRAAALAGTIFDESGPLRGATGIAEGDDLGQATSRSAPAAHQSSAVALNRHSARLNATSVAARAAAAAANAQLLRERHAAASLRRAAALEEEAEDKWRQFAALQDHDRLKRQRLWLGILAQAAGVGRLLSIVTSARAASVTENVAKAMQYRKRRVFTAWAAMHRHHKLLTAASTLLHYFSGALTRFRLRRRRKSAAIVTSFLQDMAQTFEVTRSIRRYHHRVSRAKGFLRAVALSRRAQAWLVAKQFDRCVAYLRMLAFKAKLAESKGRSAVTAAVDSLSRGTAIGGGGGHPPRTPSHAAGTGSTLGVPALYLARGCRSVADVQAWDAAETSRRGILAAQAASMRALAAERKAQLEARRRKVVLSPRASEVEGGGEEGLATPPAHPFPRPSPSQVVFAPLPSQGGGRDVAPWVNSMLAGGGGDGPPLSTSASVVTVGELFQDEEEGGGGLHPEEGEGDSAPGHTSAARLAASASAATLDSQDWAYVQEHIFRVPTASGSSLPSGHPVARTPSTASLLTPTRMHNLSRAYRGKTHLPTTDPSIAGIDIGPLKVGARPPKASRRLSVELAALQLRILTEQPAVDRHLKREMVTALMQVHRQAYARQLRAWREEVAAFEEQMEEELQRAETKLYLLDSLRTDPAPGAGGGPTPARSAHQDGVGGGGGDGNSREESMQQVRAYIQRRCPPRPIFSPVISYKLLLPVVRAAVAEQRLRDIESGTSGSRQAGAGLPPVGDAAPAPGVVAPPASAGQGLPVADTPRDSTLASVATVELPPDAAAGHPHLPQPPHSGSAQPGTGAPARPRNLLMSNARARARIRRAALHRRGAAAPSHAPTGGEAGDGMTEVKASVLLGFLEHSGSGPRVDTSSPTSPSSPALSFTPSPEPQEQ